MLNVLFVFPEWASCWLQGCNKRKHIGWFLSLQNTIVQIGRPCTTWVAGYPDLSSLGKLYFNGKDDTPV